MAAFLLTDLDPSATLACLEGGVRRRRDVEIEDLQLIAHWCDLHASDPRDDPRPDPSLPMPPGSDRLVRLGGRGTPRVRELSMCELGIARGVHTLTARAAAADVLDLRHRLPQTWAVFLGGGVDAWVVRRVASMTRELSSAAVALVDAAAARAVGSQGPARVFALVEAKIIEVDPAAHEARLEEARRARFVSLSRTDAAGLRHVIARVSAGDAVYVDAVVSRVADILAERPEHQGESRDVLRSIAFTWLARPAELLQLLLEHQEAAAAGSGEHGEAADAPQEEPPGEEPVPVHVPRAFAFPVDLLDALRSAKPSLFRPRTVLYVHLHEAALAGAGGVARVEGLGPMAMSQLAELLAHTRVSIRPVIDLPQCVSSTAYEHPESIKERIHLIHPGDTFPHATRTSRKVDLDHPVPYDPLGPPGQTSSHTGRPLSRTPHRAKTHLGYQVRGLPTGECLWRSPHGLRRVVDAAGTHLLVPDDAAAWTSDDPLDRALVRLEHRARTGQLTRSPQRR